MPTESTPDADHRPTVAILVNSMPPYRVHFHRRLARELPGVRVRAVRTHDEEGRWSREVPADIDLTSITGGTPVTQQGRPGVALREWRNGARIIDWLATARVRAVVLNGYNDVGRLRVLRWCRDSGVPCLIFGDSNIRGDRARGIKGAVKRRVVGRVLSWSRAALACGSLGRAYFERYGVPPERIFYSPYEPDYGLIRTLPAARIAEASQQFGLRAGRRRLVYSGRLDVVKRVDLLVDAFVAIADRRPDWDLVILGDGPLRDALKSRVPDALCGRVLWLGHVADQSLVSAAYRACDVLVLPSDSEPWALVVNEAVAAGLAVVSSDVVGAAAELVRDGVNGRVFPAGDLAALRDCLLDVTQPGRTETLQAGSPAVLDDWRRRGDPVEGMRQALRSVGVI